MIYNLNLNSKFNCKAQQSCMNKAELKSLVIVFLVLYSISVECIIEKEVFILDNGLG